MHRGTAFKGHDGLFFDAFARGLTRYREGQLGEASGGQARAVKEGVLGELNIFSLLDQRAKDHFHVEASEVITKA